MGESNRPIAIKFATPSKPKPSAPASTLGKRPRAGAGAFGGDSDSEDDSHQHGKKEEITGFSVDGQELSEKKRREEEEEEKNKKQYVIQRMSNKDWRAEARAKRDPTASSNNKNQTATETAQEPTIKWGLSVKDKNESKPDDAQTQEAPAEEPEKPKSADQEAIDALEGKTQSKQLVIAALTEDEAYQRDASEAGAVSTLEDYEAMPVEEFGAALLRGMGWDGKSSGKQREVKRRPNRLGLGAKELDGAEDLGAWGQQKKKVRLADYRREQDKKRSDSGGGRDSYKKEREREKERDRDRYDGGRRSDDRRDDRRREERRRDDRRHDDRRRHHDRRR